MIRRNDISNKQILENELVSKWTTFIYSILTLATIYFSIYMTIIFAIVTIMYWIEFRYWATKYTLLNLKQLQKKRKELGE